MQDNGSAIKIERNGKRSGRRTKHIDIRYFWVKDRLDANGIEIEYCRKESMLADYFTKPLQGGLFHKMQKVIMEHEPIGSWTIEEDKAAALEERVGENDQSGSAGGSEDQFEANTNTSPRRQTYAEVTIKGLNSLGGRKGTKKTLSGEREEPGVLWRARDVFARERRMCANVPL